MNRSDGPLDSASRSANLLVDDIMKHTRHGDFENALGAADDLETVAMRSIKSPVVRGSREQAAPLLLLEKQRVADLFAMVPEMPPDVRHRLFCALGYCGGEETVAAIVPLLNENIDARSASGAVFALHLIGGPVAFEKLQSARSNESLPVRTRKGAQWYANELGAGGTVDLIYDDGQSENP